MMERADVTGLILAAGGSTRMGTPKALLPIEGLVLINAHVAALAARCSVVRVVLGAHGQEIDAVLPPWVERRWNPEWASTELRDSIVIGLQDSPPDALVVLTPVDVPPVPTAVLETLLAAAEPAVPTHDGREGHPVVIRVEPTRSVLTARPLFEALSNATRVPVQWPDCTIGFNTPEAFELWRGSE